MSVPLVCKFTLDFFLKHYNIVTPVLRVLSSTFATSALPHKSIHTIVMRFVARERYSITRNHSYTETNASVPDLPKLRNRLKLWATTETRSTDSGGWQHPSCSTRDPSEHGLLWSDVESEFRLIIYKSLASRKSLSILEEMYLKFYLKCIWNIISIWNCFLS